MTGDLTTEQARHTGVVVAFDARLGSGTVRTDDGRELYFHCTAIVGGGRTVEPGTKVSFVVIPGHRGRWEAAGLTPLG